MKKIITKILTREQLSSDEYSEFIEKYVEKKKGKAPTGEEILRIKDMARQGFFDITFAAKEFAKELGLTVITVENIVKNRIERIDVYD